MLPAKYANAGKPKYRAQVYVDHFGQWIKKALSVVMAKELLLAARDCNLSQREFAREAIETVLATRRIERITKPKPELVKKEQAA